MAEVTSGAQKWSYNPLRQLTALAALLVVSPITPSSAQVAPLDSADACAALRREIEQLRQQIADLSGEIEDLKLKISELDKRISQLRTDPFRPLWDPFGIDPYFSDWRGKNLEVMRQLITARSNLINALERYQQLLDAMKRRLEDLLKKKTCPPPTTTPPPQPQPPQQVGQAPPIKLAPADRRILDLHNQERLAAGVPPLQWDAALAASATAYAAEMARTGTFAHASRDGRGIVRENINQAFHGSSPDQLMANWLGEKRNFVPGTFPNVSRTGNWYDVGHYSQMIWPTTTHVGCGSARGAQWDFFVCRYSPGGNKEGQPVGLAMPAN